MNVSFRLPHAVAVSDFIVCACTGMLCKTHNFGCVAIGSAVLFILISRLLLYSAGSGVNRVQVVWSAFSHRYTKHHHTEHRDTVHLQ